MAGDVRYRERKNKHGASSANGYVKSSVGNGLSNSLDKSSKRRNTEKSLMRRSVSTFTRLALWYALITVIFRCPSSPETLTDDSPSLCKTYLSTKELIVPYAQPYYDTYLSKHVAVIQPHISRVNDRLVLPASNFLGSSYNAYGKPRVEQVQKLSKGRWEQSIKPQIEALEIWSKNRYETTLAPHARKLIVATQPYYQNAVYRLLNVYHVRLLPTYRAASPYAEQTYQHGRKFTLETALPFAEWVGNRTIVYMSRIVLPRIQILYGENIEPQLSRIGQRLGRYRDSKKVEQVAQDVKSSSLQGSISAETSESSDTAASSASLSSGATSSEIASADKPSASTSDKEQKKNKKPSEKAVAAAAVINEDLKKWQEKFEKAAEDGVEDLQQRIKSITDDLIQSQIHGTGKAYLVKLEEASPIALKRLKNKINSVVKDLPANHTPEDENIVLEQVINASRDAALPVKESAQELRDWKQWLDTELADRVEEVSSSTISVLVNIKELGMQDMGMRWMYMEGVTHKDWKRFHDFKNQVETWKKEIRDIAKNHTSVNFAKREADLLEQKGMDVAEAAAAEINRLREVAKWKIRAKDDSDNFSDQVLASSLAEEVSEIADDIISIENSAVESASHTSEQIGSEIAEDENEIKDASSKIVSAASDASEHPPKPSEEAEHTVETASKKVLGGAMAQFVEAKQIVFEDVVESDATDFSGFLQSIASDLGDRAADLTKIVSEALLEPTTTNGNVASMTSLAQEKYESALSAASTALYGTEQGTGESISSLGSAKYSQAVTAASYAIYGTPTPVAISIAAAASSRYISAKDAAKGQYDAAMSQLSEQIAGTPKPVHEQMKSSIESVYSESLEPASSKMHESFGSRTSANPMEAVSSIASSRLEAGLSLASAQYSSAKAAFVAEPTPASKQYLADAQRRYYEGIGIAHARYSEFLETASHAIYGTPTPASESLISAAQSQYSEAVSAASAKMAGLVGSESSKVPGQAVLEEASKQYDAAISAASSSLSEATVAASKTIYGTSTGSIESASSMLKEQADSLASTASTAIYGTEKPWTDAAMMRASDNWESLVSKASEQIYGTPATFTYHMVSQANSYAAQATDAAAAQYFAVQALVSELLVGKEPDFTESVMSRFQSAYSTGIYAMASSASSYANEAFESASSVASSVFTPPPALESILGSANEQINSAVEAASVQVYGSEKGKAEKATSAAADAYISVQSKASVVIHGTEPSYVEAVQSSLADLAASAQESISIAIYGTPTGAAEAAASSVAGMYASVSSVVDENVAAATTAVGDSYEAVKSKASSAIYGPEQDALESAMSRLAAAIESGKAQVIQFGESSSDVVGEKVADVKAGADDMASSVGSVVSSATNRVKDEL